MVNEEWLELASQIGGHDDPWAGDHNGQRSDVEIVLGLSKSWSGETVRVGMRERERARVQESK